MKSLLKFLLGFLGASSLAHAESKPILINLKNIKTGEVTTIQGWYNEQTKKIYTTHTEEQAIDLSAFSDFVYTIDSNSPLAIGVNEFAPQK